MRPSGAMAMPAGSPVPPGIGVLTASRVRPSIRVIPPGTETAKIEPSGPSANWRMVDPANPLLSVQVLQRRVAGSHMARPLSVPTHNLPEPSRISHQTTLSGSPSDLFQADQVREPAQRATPEPP